MMIMNSKLKKAMAVVTVAATSAVMLTGCGGGGDKKTEVVKIGFIAPITGNNAALGVGMKNSADLAIKHANASGKYPYKFELVVADDAADPSTAVAAANKLANLYKLDDDYTTSTVATNSPSMSIS